MKLNIVQVIDHRQGYIFYRDPTGARITVQKSNDMPVEYVEAVLENISLTIPYEMFLQLYKEE